MPQILRIGPYSIYFWSNEGDPLEPVHVHISEGRAMQMPRKSGLRVQEKQFYVIITRKYQIRY